MLCFSGFKHPEKMYQTEITAEKLNPGPTCHRYEDQYWIVILNTNSAEAQREK